MQDDKIQMMAPPENVDRSAELQNSNEAPCYTVTCDQVAWILNVFDRYLPRDSHPRVSREREMKKYGMLYEVMEAAGLKFDDDSARWNGTPNDARPYDEE